MIKDEEKNIQQIGKELINLISQMQLVVNATLEEIDNNQSLKPADFDKSLKEINGYIQDLSQIIHQSNPTL